MYHKPSDPIKFLQDSLEKVAKERDAAASGSAAAAAAAAGDKKKRRYSWNLFVGERRSRRPKSRVATGKHRVPVGKDTLPPLQKDAEEFPPKPANGTALDAGSPHSVLPPISPRKDEPKAKAPAAAAPAASAPAAAAPAASASAAAAPAPAAAAAPKVFTMSTSSSASHSVAAPAAPTVAVCAAPPKAAAPKARRSDAQPDDLATLTSDMFAEVEAHFESARKDRAKMRELWDQLDYNNNGVVSLAEIDRWLVTYFADANGLIVEKDSGISKPATMRAYRRTCKQGDGDAWVCVKGRSRIFCC